jgi:hypothetical protein
MNAANVDFLTIEGDPCPVGEKPCRFTFSCVGYDRDLPLALRRNKCANLLIAGTTDIKRDHKVRTADGLSGIGTEIATLRRSRRQSTAKSTAGGTDIYEREMRLAGWTR